MPGVVTAESYQDVFGLIEHRSRNVIVNARHLFLQAANVRNKRINLRLGYLLPITWHFAPAIRNRVEDTLIANLSLPLRVGKIASGSQLSLEGVCSTIFPVARGASPAVDCRRSGSDLCLGNYSAVPLNL